MPRAVSNVPRLKRKKQILKHARGAFGARSKLWKAAKENVERGWKYAYRDRKNKKRDFRRLWIVRINAAARQHDMSYNVFMNGPPLTTRSRPRCNRPRTTTRSSRWSPPSTVPSPPPRDEVTREDRRGAVPALDGDGPGPGTIASPTARAASASMMSSTPRD